MWGKDKVDIREKISFLETKQIGRDLKFNLGQIQNHKLVLLWLVLEEFISELHKNFQIITTNTGIVNFNRFAVKLS